MSRGKSNKLWFELFLTFVFCSTILVEQPARQKPNLPTMPLAEESRGKTASQALTQNAVTTTTTGRYYQSMTVVERPTGSHISMAIILMKSWRWTLTGHISGIMCMTIYTVLRLCSTAVEQCMNATNTMRMVKSQFGILLLRINEIVQILATRFISQAEKWTHWTMAT